MADKWRENELYMKLRGELEKKAKKEIAKQKRRKKKAESEGEVVEIDSLDAVRADLTLKYFLKSLRLTTYLISLIKNCSLRALLLDRESVVIGGTELAAQEVFQTSMKEIKGKMLSEVIGRDLDSDRLY